MAKIGTAGASALRYLNSAESTSKFQTFFGVEGLKHNDRHSKNGPTTPLDHYKLDTPADDVETSSPSTHSTSMSYRINNKAAYYLFKFGSLLGQEEFYISFFPFWFWNFDGPTGRKMIIVWALSMYVGQYLKEYLRWPRPASPPVVYLEKLFLSEYGMPSTHAIVATCVPFSIVYFEQDLCPISKYLSSLFVLAYMVLVCSSRIYLGVHTIIEVIVGLIISAIVIVAYVPFAEDLDHWMMNSLLGPASVIWLCLGASLIYPSDGRRWSCPWADTVSIIAVCAGVISGSWLGFRTGVWTWKRVCLLRVPDLAEAFRFLLRTILGLVVTLCTRAVVKPAYYTFASTLHHVKMHELKEKRWTCIELPAKFLTYFAIAFNVCFLIPSLFVWLGLSRF